MGWGEGAGRPQRARSAARCALALPTGPSHAPTAPCRILYSLASYTSCGCLDLVFSSFMATSSPVVTLVPR